MVSIVLFTALMIAVATYFDSRKTTVFDLTTDTSKIEIVSSERVDAKNEISVIGMLRNAGPDIKFGFKVTAAYFDKAGKLLNVGDTYITGNLVAGETRPFKVRFSCGDPGLSAASYDHYKITVHGN